MTISPRKYSFALCIACALGAGFSTAQAEIPPAAQAFIKSLGVAPELLKGWEDEQKVPAEWVEKARKEGNLRVYGSWNNRQFRELSEAFSQRYPFIKLVYTRGNVNTRVQKPLIAFKEGRYIADLLTGIGGAIFLFREADALADLKVLPNFGKLPEGMGSKTGIWAGLRMRYWCMSYNPKLISKADMPRRWEDLVTSTKLRDGKLALGQLPQLWLLPLWGTKGEEWTTDYMKKVFTLNPHRRKEGMNQLVNLVAAGEYAAAVATAGYRIKEMRDKGAPVAWHCPEPVPVAISEAGVLRGGPNIHAAYLYMNWLLSKEGQLAQYAASAESPAHRELFDKGFLPFAEEIHGKEIAFRSPELLGDDTERKFFGAWNPLWESAGRQ